MPLKLRLTRSRSLWLPALLVGGATSQACSLYTENLLDQARAGDAPDSLLSGGPLREPSNEPSGMGGAEPSKDDESLQPDTGAGSGGTSPSMGGSGSTDGTGGASGGGPSRVAAFAFPMDLQGFFVSFENTTGGFPSKANWDSTVGDPSPGSARLEISTAGENENITFTRTLGEPLMLAGQQITARVRLNSGLSGNPACPGGAYVVAKSTDAFVFARGPWRNLLPSDGWVTISLDLDSPDWIDEAYDPSDFDANDIREFGIGIATGGADCPAPDWQDADVQVDTVDY